MKRVAIQGYKGCFHEQAARQFYAGEGITPEIVECDTFADLYTKMDEGAADAAVMAIENTLSGGLIQNFELLQAHNQNIKGEKYLGDQQNLLALQGERLEDIREVRTHYMAINQTRRFFQRECPWITLTESEDTAKSAADIAREGTMGVGAVASQLAAELYGLEVIRESIETYKQNYTRFLIMDDNLIVPREKIDKSSICFTLPHKPGSLAHILTILSFYDMNLTRIQSLPIPGKKWQYFFYVDLRFADFDRYLQSLAAVRPLIEDFSILGEYTSAL